MPANLLGCLSSPLPIFGQHCSLHGAALLFQAPCAFN